MTEEIKKLQNELIGYVDTIEAEMNISVDPTDGEDIALRLKERVALLGICAKMMKAAVEMYDRAKDHVIGEAMLNADFMKAKDRVQGMYLAGKLAKYNALYVQADRSHKDLDMSIEGLRSLLSYDKALHPHNINPQKQS